MGDIALVPPEERISGPGASYVMAAFTHINPKGSRFSDGSYGVYSAAAALETAIAETVFHFELFARDCADPPRSEDMRVLLGTMSADFEDLATLPAEQRRALLDPASCAASQAYAKRLKASGANGVAYPSVRHASGQCIGAFRPRVVAIPHQKRHLKYRWNAERVDRYFDYARDQWIDLG